MLHRILLAGIGLFAVTLASPAESAALSEIEGAVLVNHGAGFQRISGPVTVGAGARVMANAGGSAVIVYDNGCRERVEPGAIVTVKPDGTCDQAGWAPYALGALVVGAGTAVIIGFTDTRNKPASP